MTPGSPPSASTRLPADEGWSALDLQSQPESVPRARRLVTDAAEAGGLGDVSGDAALVVTELVTNALLHACPPLSVRVGRVEERLRIEVTDGSPVTPVRGLANEDSMTGRGLAFVDTLCSGWGVERRASGKMVWAELDAGGGKEQPEPDIDPEALLAAWTDEHPDSETRYTIVLGDVPTSLLLVAKAHVDNLVREFALAASGAAAGQTADVPRALAELIETVTYRFSEARQAIKRQALVASRAGQPRTRLELTLPKSAADAGEAYLAALAQADAYARDARLLTLASPPEHLAFRRWYVTSLVQQLRADPAARTPPPSFEEFLLSELVRVSVARHAAERAARLQSVTASLSAATSADQVADVVLATGVVTAGALRAALLLPDGAGHLTVPGTVGYDERLLSRLQGEALDDQLPAVLALRTGTPVWIESPEERDTRFPQLATIEPGIVSLCAVPLLIGKRVLGVLRFSFERQRLFDEDTRGFLLALASQAAQALERCLLDEAQAAARAAAETLALRLARLQDITAAFAAAAGVDEIAEVVVSRVATMLGAVVVSLSLPTDPDSLQMVRIHRDSPGAPGEWDSYPVSAALPASEAARTRRPVVVRMDDAFVARYPKLGGHRDPHRTLVCLPLVLADRVLGVLSLSFPPDVVPDNDEMALVLTAADQCALALERSRLFDAERQGRERAAFLVRATQLLASSLEPEQTLANVTDILVPTFADWVYLHLCDETGRPFAVTAAHRDPVADAFVKVFIRTDEALDTTAAGGVGEVIRTGRSVRYDAVPELVRERAAPPDATPELAGLLKPSTGMGIPLRVRDRVIGSIALARIDGPAYTPDDQVLVEQIADRAAVAVDNAQRFWRERDTALALQRSLLPQELPSVPGLHVAWRYLPGTAGTYVGGDWYDVIPLDDGQVALVIGDVMGHGVQAAAVMGQLRATARAYAAADLRPGQVLALLDRAVARLEQGQITTVAFAVLDPRTRRLVIASAGHLPPLLVDGTDHPQYLDLDPGPPLGAGGTDFPERALTLPEGAMLLLFTDGLVEDRSRPVDEGLTRLQEAVAGPGADPEQLCEQALAVLGPDRGHEDDTALLAVSLDRRTP